MNSKTGTYAAVGMLLVAVTATVGNFWYQRSRAARPLALWGTENARLIGLASKVTALRLAPQAAFGESPESEVITLQGRSLQVLETQEASAARGLKNIRQGLLAGASYEWNAPPDDCDPQWEYALRFSDGASTATLLFALNCGRIALAGSNAEASAKPTIKGYEEFLREQFPLSQAKND